MDASRLFIPARIHPSFTGGESESESYAPSGYSPNRSKLIAGLIAIALALGVKAFYSNAGATQLLWILAPSAWLARAAGGIDLVWEPGAGYISHAYHMVVGASCAGINFLVIAFLTLYFSFARHFSSRMRWLASSAAIAFLAAIAANGLRIVVSAHLWNADIYGGWITPGGMHRLAGVVIYYASLLGLYLAVAARAGVAAPKLAPLAWYIGVSLGVPMAGRLLAGGGPGFTEHALWVGGIALALTALMFLPSVWRNRLCWRP
jgi:exosortase K